MSSGDNIELKPPSPEEVNKLRDELRSMKLKGKINDLDDDAIEEILHLPPSLFYEAIHYLVIAYGPLSSFPAAEYPFASVSHSDSSKPKPPKSIVDDGATFLDDAVAALTDYNKLLEDKVAKFKIQSSRSLATLEEASEPEHDITALQEKTAEIKERKSQHAQQIALLKDSLESHDKNMSLRLGEYSRTFWSETLFLNCINTFSENGHLPARQMTPSDGLWDEYDYVLQHIDRWKRLVNVDSNESKLIIDRARQHVNQLVFSITRHCQVQLATIFHKTLAGNTAKSTHQKALHDEIADIVKEIDWLWEEVIPVAHMSVSAQFLRPVLKTFENWESSKLFRDTVVTTYASGVLKFMNDRLGAVAERTRMLVYHHQVLNDVARVRQSKGASSSIKEVLGHKPNIPAQGPQHRRQRTAASENLRAFMQIYGAVPVHTDDPHPKPTASLLDRYVQTRAQKGDALLQDLHKLFEDAARSGLTDQELGSELLLESLLADSAASPTQPGSVYKDTQLEGSIAMLRSQAEEVQGIFQSLKLEGPASAPDYIDYAYRQTIDRLSAKAGERCLRGGENQNSACMACVRCVKFEEFVRKWGT